MNQPPGRGWVPGTAQHGKDEALRLFTGYLNAFPKPTDKQRAEAEATARRLIELAAQRQAGRSAVLESVRGEFGVERPSQELRDPAGLEPDASVAEVEKGREKALGVAELKRLTDEHTSAVVPLQQTAREAEALERKVSDLVNAAYGLTPAEVRLMWDTAPPPMPTAPPG